MDLYVEIVVYECAEEEKVKRHRGTEKVEEKRSRRSEKKDKKKEKEKKSHKHHRSSSCMMMFLDPLQISYLMFL